MIAMVTMKKIILLKRDSKDKNVVTKLSTADAVQYLLAHELMWIAEIVRDNRKIELRKEFFRRHFEQTDVHLVNTTGTPQATQTEIVAILSVKR